VNLIDRRRVLHLHPHRADVLIERIEGEPPNFILFCVRHQYAAPAAPHMDYVGACPLCVAEYEGSRGRARYAALHGAGVSIEGWH
jgi:hypothetical protein